MAGFDLGGMDRSVSQTYVVIDDFRYLVLEELGFDAGTNKYRLQIWDYKDGKEAIVSAKAEKGPYKFDKKRPESAIWRGR